MRAVKTAAKVSEHQRENEELEALRVHVMDHDPGQRKLYGVVEDEDEEDEHEDAWANSICQLSDKIKGTLRSLLAQGGLYTIQELMSSDPIIVVYLGEEHTEDWRDGPGAWGMVFKFMMADGSPMILTWTGRGEESVLGEKEMLMYSTNNSYLYGFPRITRIA